MMMPETSSPSTPGIPAFSARTPKILAVKRMIPSWIARTIILPVRSADGASPEAMMK